MTSGYRLLVELVSGSAKHQPKNRDSKAQIAADSRWLPLAAQKQEIRYNLAVNRQPI
jgi:hypothetical protein